MKKVNKNGFTLVELLGVVTLLGIIMLVAIPNVSKLIDKSKDSKKESNKKTLLLAGKSYMQANKTKLPKAIGENAKVDAQDLKSSGFLKEDLVDGNKVSCMDYSYVSVKKKSSNKYEYVPHLYCGSETPDELEEITPYININLYAYNSTGEDDVVSGGTSDLINRVKIDYYGNGDGTTEPTVSLTGYNYFIAVAYRKGENEYEDDIEIRSAPSMNPYDKTKVTADINLAEYIDVTREFRIKVIAKAYNAEGFNYEATRTIDPNDPQDPTCDDVKIYALDSNGKYKSIYTGKYKPEDDNKVVNTPTWAKSGPRKAVVTCKDNAGSGCQKEKYTKIFIKTGTSDDEVNDKGKGVVEVKDNKGNTGRCYVPINIDDTPPSVPTVNMYNWKNNTTRPTNSNGLTEYKSGDWTLLSVYTEPHSTDAGVGDIYYQYTTTGATENNTDKTAKYRNIEAKGKSYIKWRACDKLDNCSEYSDLNSVFIAKDAERPSRPTISFYTWDGIGDPESLIKSGALNQRDNKYNPGSWTNKNVIVYFSHPDQTNYDITYYYDKEGTDPEIEINGNYLVFAEDINATYQFYAKDGLNRESWRTDWTTIKIDKTPPTFNVELKKNSTSLKSCTGNFCELDGTVEDSMTIRVDTVRDSGSGVNRDYEFAWNAGYLDNFSEVVSNLEQRRINIDGYDTRDITSYGKRILWVTISDKVGNEAEMKIKADIVSGTDVINGTRFLCDSSTKKLGIYHISECPSDLLCYYTKLNGLSVSGQNSVDRTKLTMAIGESCIKTKCVTASAANCRNGASTNGTTVKKTISNSTSMQVAETTTSGWSYSLDYGCYISSNLMADSCSSSSGGGTSGYDIPSSSTCSRYKRCSAAGCAKSVQHSVSTGGFKYKGHYDSGGRCEPKYSPSRCGRGTSCSNCTYTTYTYECTLYNRGPACGCEY
ncbi:MAG: prepilin-type N-terminal cleavage/methylation domain-containing protein [Bacilli bacterium]|nr:prepilin-type N-terminal cleavage/methylation domain-containing protein [Bacilli bacterium]